ncbi:hypothetical protein [Clostridium sp. DJ247]|uniref:hypothetical protein n=1 Tax=Clostridium sp. DJ247 TaxID=2726188 RepID=UPI0016265F20|nr:hypothetical protein [Clostridium sp. DJ247]MBC2580814.1 hypothetical protein [Clostridium sp. DJ247]
MFNLIKYELKSYYKDFAIIASIILITNLLLFTRINVWPKEAVFTLSCLIGFAAMIFVLIWNIKVFSRDMYEDTGSLIFTLPQSGSSILTSKMLTALIQAAVIGIISIVFTMINFHIVLNNETNFMDLFKSINPSAYLFLFVSTIFEYAQFILTIYFSITLSKFAIKKRKMGKFGSFVIFVIISLGIGKIAEMIRTIFPQNFEIKIFLPMVHSSFNTLVDSSVSFLPVNIATVIFEIILFIALFIGTSYIMEKKLDL